MLITKENEALIGKKLRCHDVQIAHFAYDFQQHRLRIACRSIEVTEIENQASNDLT